MTSSGRADPGGEIRSTIASVRRRWMMQVRLRAAGVAMTAAAATIAAALMIIRAGRVDGLALVVLAAAASILAAGAASMPLFRARRAPAARQVARFIEERVAGLTGDESLNDALVSAVDVAERKGAASVPFGDALLAAAARRLDGVSPRDIVPAPRVRVAALWTLTGSLLLLLAFVASAPVVRRAADAARVQFFPSTVRLDVLPGNVRIPAGKPLRISTFVRGEAGSLKQVTPVLTLTSAEGRQSLPMSRAGESFEYSIPAVDRNLSYYVSAGRARSGDYTITALSAPRVTRIDLRYVYPAFAGLAPRDEHDGGDIYAPAGTRVRLRIHASGPVTRGEIRLRGGSAVAVRTIDTKLLEADVVLARDDSYRIELADADGLKSVGDTEYFIRLMNDRPPDVRILRPSADQKITPLEEIAIEARADDDYGIAGFDLVYGVGGGPRRTVPFDRVTGTDVERVGRTLLSAEALDVKPGDVISYYARARDVGRGKRPTEATSDIFFLEVKPFSEEFVAAESQAGGRGGGEQIDSLVEAQKQIIASTWNIERRSAAGRSSDDVMAVARAQSMLKTRAEQMSLPARRRPGLGLPPQRSAREVQARGESDPISAAVRAMAKAMEQLETERTREALPHEMAALDGLLKAQAEVRRREVARQQASGSGNNGNRSGEDLSALFDRELQRQQQTNYETRPALETRADRTDSNDSVLDRVRDLARRQEDLSRRQRELSKEALAMEDLRRELQKLTREQAELREQAEELARRLDAQRNPTERQNGSSAPSGSSSGRSSGQGTQGQGSRSVQDAVEQMRAATNDLRRDDPGAAAANGARAAEQLRKLGERPRGGRSEGDDRDGSGAQVEAQQIAQEQRRIAAEAARLDGDGTPGAAEAWKRLADEKDRLAERVEALRSGRERAKGGAGAGDSGLAHDLEGLVQRMRDSAKKMRGAPRGASERAGGEQELARASERIAGRLGSGDSPEARQLSDRLEQSRAIRERLQRLEQQMREPGRGAASSGTASSTGRAGQQGADGRGGGGTGQAGERQRLEQEYRHELERARQALNQLGGSQPTSGSGGGTPVDEQFSRSAPGTEAFKQDRSTWDSLRRDLDLALEKYEAAASARLAPKPRPDRFSAGGSERAPDGYRESIARYFESLATVKKEQR